MAKRKTSRRKRVGPPMSPGTTAPMAARPVAAPLPVETAAVPPPPPAAARAPDAARPKPGSRFAHRDYAYVMRDIQRIIILSVLIIIAIVVLSFFLP